MALSDALVRHAKATGKAYTLGDIDGLSLAVSPEGGKSWHFRYCWAGKQKRMSLGIYPEVGLREARALRDEARALLARDINPHTERKRKRHAIVLAGEHTFMAVYTQWLAHRRLTLEATVFKVKQKSSIFHGFFLRIRGRPSDPGFEDGVDDGQQFSHARDQRDFGRLADGFQSLVEGT